MEFSFLSLILPLVGAFIGILMVASTAKTVPQGYNLTVERFGRYTRTLTPGLNVITPFVDKVGHKMNMMEQVLDVPRQDVITKDNASVGADGVAFYQITDARQAAYEVHGLQNALLNLVMTNLRSVMGGMDLEDILTKRDDISQKVLQTVDLAASSWGVKVTRIEIKDVTPPKDIVDAMNRQMKAERDKRAVILEAEGRRSAMILKAEGEKQSQVLEATGRFEAAEQDAKARERLAEAEAKATQAVSEAMEKGGQAAAYFLGQKYIEALREMGTSNNHKIIMMPLESSAMVGSLAGIAELASGLGITAASGNNGGRTPVGPGRTDA